MKSLSKSIFLFSIQALLLGSLSAAMISLPTDPLPANGDTKDGLVVSRSTTGFEGHRWSWNDPEWEKTFGLANNRYGNAGYVLFAPTSDRGSIPLANVTAGTSVIGGTNVTSLPTFISSITYASDGNVGANSANYNQLITRPDANAVSDDFYAGVFNIFHAGGTFTQDSSEGGKGWHYGAALTITLSQDAHFRMGVMSNFHHISALSTWAADGFRLQDQTGIVSAAYTLGYGVDGTGPTSVAWGPDMFFFDIQGQAGDVLTLYAANVNANTDTLFNGVTFDVIPEPATVALIIGLVALMPVLWCRRRQSK